jgi:FkbH-like protein
MREIGYSEIISKNRELADELKSEPFKILVLSNSVVANLKDFIEYDLRINGINAHVEIGDFDNIMQSTFDIKHKVLILFYEAWNLYPGFYADASSKDENWFYELEDRIMTELTTLLKNARHLPLLVVNTFSSHFSLETPFASSPYSKMIDNLNHFLLNTDQENRTLFDTNIVYSELSLQKSISYKHFQLFNTLYTNDFFRTYSFYLKFIVFDIAGKIKKVLALDCDNTLWKGIVGEDGLDQLQMSWENPAGRPYFEVQKMIKSLAGKGVLITLCSKNNPADVEKVLKQHPDMTLKEDDITVMKINWNNKPDNLKEIASELNLGPESVVFWDDSDFEINMVREFLPQVTSFKVPDKTEEYPQFFRKQMGWFYRKHITSEDLQKTQMIKTHLRRESRKTEYSNIEDYLRSLQLEIHIEKSPETHMDRISQLTQKTNQFNLSLKRYTSTEIKGLIENQDYEIITFRVTDHFGDYGLTGLAILIHNDKTAVIDTFLISCRVLGRNIEYSFWNFLMDHLNDKGVTKVYARYVKSEKNKQVSTFFDKIGFRRKNETEREIDYFCFTEKYLPVKTDYIKLQH